MKDASPLDSIIRAIGESTTVCIVGHIRPDGDCVGSQVGLGLALQAQGKQVTCWNQDPMPRTLAFLDPDRLFHPPQPGLTFDCVIATDAASFERLGTVGPCVANRRRLINIDHHASNTRYGDLNWVQPDAPSTGELIFRLLETARWPVTPAIADCLFAAVSTDTGSFQYSNTRPDTFAVAGALVERGADLVRVCTEIYQSYSLSRVRLLQHLYSHFRLVHQDRTAYLWLKRADFARTGASSAESEGLIDHLRSIEPVVVACVFEEIDPTLTRVSLRSKRPEVNVSDIAAVFGGGGHAAAAGARIPGHPPTIQRKLLEAVRSALDAAL